MGSIFHKDTIFNDAQKAWETYEESPGYFMFPERITIELTNRCNLQCYMCPRNKVVMKTGDMERALFNKIIDEASKFFPLSVVPFFRGESFLHPGFIEMLRYAKEKGAKPIQLATNAYFLDTHMADRILEIGIDFISFSLDINNEDMYKKIRKNSDYERVFANILYFLDEKRRRNDDLPEIQVSAVKTTENAPFMSDFVNFWRDKVDRVRVYPVHSLDGKLGHLHNDGCHEARKPCLKLLTDMVIYWNGEVALCNHDWQRDMFIGNVKEGSIEKIWNNPTYQLIRKRHVDNDVNNFSPCNYCTYWKASYQNNYIIGELYERNQISAG